MIAFWLDFRFWLVLHAWLIEMELACLIYYCSRRKIKVFVVKKEEEP